MAPPAPETPRPALAVVVPTLDEAATLPALLDSVGWPAAGGARPAPGPAVADRLVVADGGSADGTPAVARAHGAHVVVTAPGRGTQLAAGARAADADVLVFLHADCRLAPGALAGVRRAFAAGGLRAAGLRQRVEAAGWFYRAVERAANARVRRGWVYGDSGLCVAREAYARAGGFAALPLFEDLDLSRRLRRLGRVRLIEDAEIRVSPRRWQAEGRAGRTLRNWILTAAWAAGVAPERLARHYRPRAAAGRTDEVAA